MRCQAFESSDINKLQQSINIWLKSYDGKIKVSRILQSTARTYTVVTIWYYDIEVKELKNNFDGIEVI